MLIRLIVIGLICYAALVAVLYLFQERLVFLPGIGGGMLGTPADVGMDFEEVWLDTADGERLHAWWLPHPQARASVLFSHGNAGNISHRMDSLRIFHELELNVLIYDYRGYGNSSGRPSEEGTYRDARAAWDWIVNAAAVAPDEVFLFGRSLGGAVSAWLATEVDAAGLILESTFTSVADIGAEVYWWLPVRVLARLEYDTLQRLSQTTMPVLIVHSPEDEIIPFSHAERLLKAHPERTELLELAGDHNTGFLRYRSRYLEGLDAFISRHRSGG